jgi:hypothetical protein
MERLITYNQERFPNQYEFNTENLKWEFVDHMDEDANFDNHCFNRKQGWKNGFNSGFNTYWDEYIITDITKKEKK